MKCDTEISLNLVSFRTLDNFRQNTCSRVLKKKKKKKKKFFFCYKKKYIIKMSFINVFFTVYMQLDNKLELHL